MTLTARPGLAILFVLLAALALFLALSLSGPPAQAQDGSVSDQDEEPDVSYVTVVVDRTPEPSVTQFTVTWNDAHEGKCSTQYNAYLVDYFVDTEDVHLGSATSDDVQIVKSVDSSGMDGGLGYRVNMVCGDYRDTDDYRYVSWIRLLGGLPSGTYSSEPALIGLVVDSGSLEPAFHQYKFSYVVDDVPASRRPLHNYSRWARILCSHPSRRITHAPSDGSAVARSLSEKQCSKRYASLVECKDAIYSTTKSRLL